MPGYIKIHRRLKRHWLWTDPVKFQWWILMIMEANFSDAKMKLGNEIITVKRGQSAMSIRSWAELFGTGVKSATNFLDMLQKDGMISRQTVGKGKQSTTLINIENYELFQGVEETQAQREGNASATQAQREGHTIEEGNKGIRKEGNNINQNKHELLLSRKKIFASTLEPFVSIYGKDMVNDFYKYWTEPNKSGTKFKQELEKTWSLERRLETWAKNDYNKIGRNGTTTQQPKRTLEDQARAVVERIHGKGAFDIATGANGYADGGDIEDH